MSEVNYNRATIEKLNSYIDSKFSTDDGISSLTGELDDLFGEIEYYNDGDEAKADIQKQIETLEKKISGFEERKDALQKQIEDLTIDITKEKEELIKITSEIATTEMAYKEKIEEASEDAADRALEAYKADPQHKTFEDCYSEFFKSSLGNMAGSKIKIQSLMFQYQTKENEIATVSSAIQAISDSITTFTTDLDTTVATINMLTRTKNNMSSKMEGVYQNVDTDTNTPIFSGRKAEVANELLAKYQSRYTKDTTEAASTSSFTAVNAEGEEAEFEVIATAEAATTGVYGEGETVTTGDLISANSVEAAKATWLDKKDPDNVFTSGDIYNKTSNPELAELGQLIEGGMLTELKDAGMGPNDIMSFINENWKVGIKQDQNGNWQIPYGHGTSGHRETNKAYLQDADGTSAIYQALSDMYKVDKTPVDPEVDASTVNQAQMEEMQKAINEDKILDTMYKEGFSYKEMMYTLTKLFPDAGIEYDVSDQNTGSNPANPNDPSDTRHYTMVKDSKDSGDLYKTIGTEILNKWNVGSTQKIVDIPEPDPDPDPVPQPSFDPMVFQQGNKTYTFITDRNNDGNFDYTDGYNNELLGSKDGANELLAFDYNGDGKIDANDKVMGEDGKVKMMKTIDYDANGNLVHGEREMTALDQLTLMINKQDESISDSADIDKYKDASDQGHGKLTNEVDFNVTYTSAYELGITEIDLSGMSAGERVSVQNNAEGDEAANFFDANHIEYVNGESGEILANGEERFDNNKYYDNTQEEFEDINGSAIINQFKIKTNGGNSSNELDKEITANETLNSKENLETFYSNIANIENAKDGKWKDTNSDKIVSKLSTEEIQDSHIFKMKDGKLTSESDFIKDNYKALILDDNIRGHVINIIEGYTADGKEHWGISQLRDELIKKMDASGYDEDHMNINEINKIFYEIQNTYKQLCEEEEPLPPSTDYDVQKELDEVEQQQQEQQPVEEDDEPAVQEEPQQETPAPAQNDLETDADFLNKDLEVE